MVYVRTYVLIVLDGVVGVSDGVPQVSGQVLVGVFGVLGARAVRTAFSLLWDHGVGSMPRGFRALEALAI